MSYVKSSAIFLLSISISSCAYKPVLKVPDVVVCLDNNAYSGYCNMTVTKIESDIEGPEWIEFKEYSVKMHVRDWAKMKAFIMKICKATKQCDIGKKDVR
jgi:hypothetical protein